MNKLLSMEEIDLKNCLYHGIVDWLNYDREKTSETICLEKLESILKCRYIYRPCDFKKKGIKHNDVANPYTYYFAFVACHFESIYAKRFLKNEREDDGYTVATSYALFGFLLDSKLLEELAISDEVSFCDKEIMIEDNISIDQYGLGIYINPQFVNIETCKKIEALLRKYQYPFPIINIVDGEVVIPGIKEKNKVFVKEDTQ